MRAGYRQSIIAQKSLLACEVALVVWFFLQASFPGTAPLTQSEIAYRKSH